jgi:hypothetical protein
VRLYARGRAGQVRFTVRDEDGEPAAPTGPVSVDIVDADGDSVVSGTAVSGGSTGVYAFTLPADVRDVLGRYEATFTYTLSGTTYDASVPFEVVGGFLFEVADMRDRYPELDDPNRYPADVIRASRDEATSRLEQAAQVAFAPRASRAVLDGDDTTRLVLPDVEVSSVSYVEVSGVPYTDVDVAGIEADPIGVLIKTDGSVWDRGTRNIFVVYEHGYETTPAPVKRAAMKLALEDLIPSSLPSRAMTQSTDLGEIRYSMANPEAGRPTGDPEIDAVIHLFGRNRPSVG